MPQKPLDLYRQRLREGALAADPAQEKAACALQRLYDDIAPRAKTLSLWKKKEAPPGVYLYGGVGRGKSMLMDLFYSCLSPEMPKRRVHFHEFMIGVHDYFHERRAADDYSEGVDDLLPALAGLIAREARVLCFDEFHVTDVADAMILGRLFTALFDRGVIVVATSNWAPGDLYTGGLQRDRFLPFIELLKNRMEIVHLDGGTDYRTKFLQEEGTYFTPPGDDTARQLDDLFAHLTDREVPHAESLSVKGRDIPVRVVARGVARFTFAELCMQPHAAEDYLKIAGTYHTIFLENVPQLSAEQRNEARRLMILVDTLYETGTKLVISAAVPAEQIYTGHDHGFEFQRTVSRLLEMQSAAYLAKN
jgi:cell division protein ZapE